MHYKLIYPNDTSFSFTSNNTTTNDNNSLYLKFIENNIPLYKHDETLSMLHILNNERRLTQNIITDLERKEIDEDAFNFWEQLKQRVITRYNNVTHVDNSDDNSVSNELYNMLYTLKANNVKELYDTEREIYDTIDMYFTDKTSNEQTLRNEQENEIQTANTTNTPLDIIVNKHISQLTAFTSDYKQLFLSILTNKRKQYKDTITTLSTSANTTITSSPSPPPQQQSSSLLFHSDFIFFTTNCISLRFYIVNDLLYNDIPITHRSPLSSTNIYAMINLYAYNTTNNEYTFLFDELLTSNTLIVKELFFNNIVTVFNNDEAKTAKYVVTKHSNIETFNCMVHYNIKAFTTFNEVSFVDVMNDVFCFVIRNDIRNVIIPVEKVIHVLYNVNKYSEFKNVVTAITKVVELIKVCKCHKQLTMHFELSKEFMQGFSYNETALIEKFKLIYNN